MERGTKIFFLLAAAIVVLFVSLILWVSFSEIPLGPREACSLSGGNLTFAMCCNSASDFPNTCLIGACGCSPDNSHQVEVCQCPEGKCFDGEKCVGQQL